MGEGPDLSDDERWGLLRAVVDAAEGKAAVVCGLEFKNTLHTIEDAKRARDLGAIGVQIPLPIFHHPTQDDYVRFYTQISEAIDIGILIYDTFWFGAEHIGVETLLRLKDAERVVAIKWDVPEGEDYDDMAKVGHLFNVIDNTLQPVRAHKLGARGYINHTAHLWPRYDLHIWDLLEARRYDEAQVELDRFYVPMQALTGKVGGRSGGYWLSKVQMAIMGRPVGPPRPPTIMPLTNEEIAELRRLMVDAGFPIPAEG